MNERIRFVPSVIVGLVPFAFLVATPALAQMEPGGRLVWVHRAGLSATDYAYDVACSQNGSCYVTGEFSGRTNQESEIFLLCLTSSGSVSWSRRAGGAFSDRGISIRVEPDPLPPFERLVMRGSGFGTLTFTSPRVSPITKYLEDELFFTATYSLAGTIQAVVDNPLDEYDLPSRKVEYSLGGGSVECGWFDFAMPLASPLTSAGGRDGYLAEYDEDGSLSWAVSFGGAGMDWATAVAVLPNEAACVVVGSFNRTASFPDSVLDVDTDPQVLNALGGKNPDIFVAKFTLRDSDGDGIPDIRE
jgi:hypothetical protein